MNGFDYDPWTYRFFPTELIFFLLGTIGYHIYKAISKINLSQRLLYTVYALVIFMTFLYGYIDSDYKIFFYLVLFGASIPFVFLLSKYWKIDRYIGELSYPIYISHMFISMLLSYTKIPTYGGRAFTMVVLTLVLSVLLNELVAKRIEVIRQNRVKR